MTDPRRHAAALDDQVAYYRTRRPVRMTPVDTPYVRRHFDELLARAVLAPHETVCEWGAGLGRFTLLLADRAASVTAIELSPEMSAELGARVADRPDVTVLTGDARALCSERPQAFDLVVGFFVLHHLPALAPYFEAAARCLRPGGRLAFVEPNPWNPLYPLQLTLTPGMRWRNEIGIYRLQPAALRRATAEAGFRRLEIGRYGSLPRLAYNALARIGAERLPDRLMPGPLRAFQTVVAWR